MPRETIVLGAGMVGVCIAYHLAKRGRSVVLVDRQPPGRETSFGNAGLIQREAVKPHPFPRDLASLWRVLPNRSIDIRYRLRGMLANIDPLLRFWINSAPSKYERIVPEYASLIMHCTDEHARMIEASGAEALIRKEGWFETYRSREVLDERLVVAEDIHERFGVTHKALDQTALKAQEPHLSNLLAGAIHWTNTWSVIDPGALVQAYAQAFEKLGGRFEQAEAKSFSHVHKSWNVATSKGNLEAEELVVALGPWSANWLQQLDYRLPMFPMRGYHMHYGTRGGAKLHHWMMDYEKGYLLTPMRAGIRLTTGAEMDTLEGPPHSGQLGAAEAEARRIFPLGERLDPAPWKGARPCMPDMKPVIGPAPKHDNLWFAFGHAHQGFTLGPATGRLLSEMMDGEEPLVDMQPFRADRF